MDYSSGLELCPCVFPCCALFTPNVKKYPQGCFSPGQARPTPPHRLLPLFLSNHLHTNGHYLTVSIHCLSVNIVV